MMNVTKQTLLGMALLAAICSGIYAIREEANRESAQKQMLYDLRRWDYNAQAGIPTAIRTPAHNPIP